LIQKWNLHIFDNNKNLFNTFKIRKVQFKRKRELEKGEKEKMLQKKKGREKKNIDYNKEERRESERERK
jgi:hypothetical protein